MGLQLRFGVAGAGIGLFIGILGGLIGGVYFGTILLRILLCVILCGGLGFALYFVIKTFLPELLQSFEPSAEPTAAETESENQGQAVNITLPEEGYQASGDQAAPLREMYETNAGGDDDAESDLIAEVSEERHGPGIAAAAMSESAFNEDAFYQGVERLPDIGGFSEQFQDTDTDGTVVSEDGTSVAPSMAGSRKTSSDSKSNMDPELIAKAIRTALKKDDL